MFNQIKCSLSSAGVSFVGAEATDEVPFVIATGFTSLVLSAAASFEEERL